MNLDWIKCSGNQWCSLNNVDLSHSHFDNMEGVYIIWHGGNSPATVRVGQGIIKDRLAVHRKDSQVQAYAELGLFVTWAQVSAKYRDGIEAYLAQKLNPKVGERFPTVDSLQVNLPW